MTEQNDKSNRQKVKPDREERLANALRENLRRRKAQAKGRAMDSADLDEKSRRQDS